MKSVVSFITGMNIDYDIVLPVKVLTCTCSTPRFPNETENGYAYMTPHTAITKTTKGGTKYRTTFVPGVLSLSLEGEGLSETEVPNMIHVCIHLSKQTCNISL